DGGGLAADGLGALGVVPEVGGGGLLAQLGGAPFERGQVKDASRARPPGGRATASAREAERRGCRAGCRDPAPWNGRRIAEGRGGGERRQRARPRATPRAIAPSTTPTHAHTKTSPNRV